MSTRTRNSFLLSPTILLTGIAAFLVLIYWESFTEMFRLWQLTSHQHGLLVFPISAFLIWRLLPRIEGIRLRADYWGVYVVVILVLTWIVSRLAGIQVTEHASVLAMFPATVLAIGGRELAYKLLFPLLFVLCAVPIGDSLVPYLMAITADISAALLTLSGVPMLRDGQYMTLPGGSFVVAEVCSGVRYFMSGMILAFLFSYLTFKTYAKRLSFLFLAAALLVFANGLRAYLIMAIASATDMRYLGGADHIYFGWALFGVVMMSMMWVGARYADDRELEESSSERSKAIGGNRAGFPLVIVLGLAMLVATLNPLQSEAISIGKVLFGLAVLAAVGIVAGRQRRTVDDEGHRSGDRPKATRDLRSLGIVVIVAIVLLTGPQFITVLRESATPFAAVPRIGELRSCDKQGSWVNKWYPRMRYADIEESATLSCPDGLVSIYVAGYAGAVQGKELVSGSNRPTPKDWGRYTKLTYNEFSARDGRLLRVNELIVDAPGYRGLIWFWYEIDARTATGEFGAKALQVWALLRGRPAGGHIVVLATPILANKQDAIQRLENVSIDVVGADLQTSLGNQT